MVQASTGIGKTMAVLFPALQSLAHGWADCIFYVTARTTGKASAEDAPPNPGKIRTQGQMGHDNRQRKDLFLSPAKTAPAPACPFASGYYDRLGDALQRLTRQDAFDRAAVEALAREHRLCPHELSLDLASWADAVVCDYNHVFDPRAYLRRFFLEVTEKYAFLVDEAHNLPDRCRDMFSAELRANDFSALRKMAKTSRPDLYKVLGEIDKWFKPAKQRTADAGGALFEKEPPDSLLPILRRFLDLPVEYPTLISFPDSGWERTALEALPSSPLTDAHPYASIWRDLALAARHFLKTAEAWGDDYAAAYQYQGRAFGLKLLCLDPARRLAEALKRSRSAICFSASLPAHHLVPGPYRRPGNRRRTGSPVPVSPGKPQGDDRFQPVHALKEQGRDRLGRGPPHRRIHPGPSRQLPGLFPVLPVPGNDPGGLASGVGNYFAAEDKRNVIARSGATWQSRFNSRRLLRFARYDGFGWAVIDNEFV